MECDLPMLLAPDGAETSFFPKLDEVVHQDAAPLGVIADFVFRDAGVVVGELANVTVRVEAVAVLAAGAASAHTLLETAEGGVVHLFQTRRPDSLLQSRAQGEHHRDVFILRLALPDSLSRPTAHRVFCSPPSFRCFPESHWAPPL